MSCFKNIYEQKKIDLTGQQFGRLTVIEPAPNKNNKTMWKCKCSCESKTECIVGTDALRRGATRSCGCLALETFSNLYQYNEELQCYEIYWEDKPYIMYVDECDFDNVMKYYWRCYCDKTGYFYVTAKINNKQIKILRFLGLNSYDHINRNSLDFRRCNLRPATLYENARNKSIAKNNTSGITGVSFVRKNGTWVARIQVDHISICLGTYVNKDDAILARLKAEAKYFGEFAPQNIYMNSMELFSI